jgi:hypothetical protein
MQLTNKALEAITSKPRILNMIALSCERSESAIRRWVHRNDPMLTTAGVLDIIKAETGLDEREILSERETVQKDA